MLTSHNNDPRWILATIVESGNHRFWGWREFFFVMLFWLLFFLHTWNQHVFFCFHVGIFSRAAPTKKNSWGKGIQNRGSRKRECTTWVAWPNAGAEEDDDDCTPGCCGRARGCRPPGTSGRWWDGGGASGGSCSEAVVIFARTPKKVHPASPSRYLALLHVHNFSVLCRRYGTSWDFFSTNKSTNNHGHRREAKHMNQYGTESDLFSLKKMNIFSAGSKSWQNISIHFSCTLPYYGMYSSTHNYF